ncbi:MAG: flagellar basal body rod protein FlgB [Janthinobacterium lividum]
MPNRLDDYLKFGQTALAVREQRQQLLASNIANADTPNFKARDIDFSKAMASAMGTSSSAKGSVTMATTSPMHMSGSTASLVVGSQGKAAYRTVMQGAVDGNTVDMDVERNQFTENGMRYEAGVTMVGGQIKSMMTAIQGQ